MKNKESLYFPQMKDSKEMTLTALESKHFPNH